MYHIATQMGVLMSDQTESKRSYYRLEIEIPTFLCAELRDEGEKAGLSSDDEIWSILTSFTRAMVKFQKLGYVILSFNLAADKTQVRPASKVLYEVYKKRSLGDTQEVSRFPIKLSLKEYSHLKKSSSYEKKFFKAMLHTIIYFIWFLTEYNKGKLVGGFDKATGKLYSLDADKLKLSESTKH